jgi:Zn-dependent peptidase ImmA (M78 family)
MARFAVAHEIGHVNLHRRQMRDKIEGAARNFTPGEISARRRLHHETQGMEDEADLYAGLLLVPLSKIDNDADFMELARKYNAPPGRVRQLRWDVMEVWSTLLGLKRKQ